MGDQLIVTEPKEWVKTYGDYLYAFALPRVKDGEYAKDLVQETFLSALSKIDGFQGKSSVKTWLTAILKNKIIDGYRKKKIETVYSDLNNPEGGPMDFFDSNGGWDENHKPSPFPFETQDSLENKDLQTYLKFCFEKLPQVWRMVFIMKNIDEEKSDFICKEMNLSASNFWVIMHRAKLALRECLQKSGTV